MLRFKPIILIKHVGGALTDCMFKQEWHFHGILPSKRGPTYTYWLSYMYMHQVAADCAESHIKIMVKHLNMSCKCIHSKHSMTETRVVKPPMQPAELHVHVCNQELIDINMIAYQLKAPITMYSVYMYIHVHVSLLIIVICSVIYHVLWFQVVVHCGCALSVHTIAICTVPSSD